MTQRTTRVAKPRPRPKPQEEEPVPRTPSGQPMPNRHGATR